MTMMTTTTRRTPGSEDTPFNFGPASSRDSILFTAARPGNPKDDKWEQIPDSKVWEWIEYMKTEKKITHVLVLLDDNELESYLPSGLENLYHQAGLKCTIQPMKAPDAAQKIFALLDQQQESNHHEKNRVVAHCTGGVGRSGRVAAGWLVHKYGLSPLEATEEVMRQAIECGVKRKGDVEMLTKWLDTSCNNE